MVGPHRPRSRRRLSPEDRRRTFIETATTVFAERGYRDTSTTQLAAAAGVTQPLLYRHFSGKAELYVACLEQAWDELRTEWERAVADEPDPAQWIPQLALAGLQLICDTDKGQLWMRGIVEASADEQVREVVATTLRSAHEFLMNSIQRAQDAGAIALGVPARVEAWLFVATGLLVVASNRLGGIVGDDIFEMLQAGHQRMLRDLPQA